MAIVFLAAVTETCGEDESATPLGPTQRPTPLQLSEGDSLVWESDFGEDTGLVYDDDTKLVQIGFDFVFYDAVEAEVYVDTNGNLHFGTSESYGYGYNSGPIPTQYAEQPRMIAPFFEDLEPYPPAGSKIYVNLIGEAPARRFVVTWFNIPFYGSGGPGGGPYNTFQVQLFEGTNQIQFGYNGLIDGANVGLARDDVEYIASNWSRDSLDMSNICYYPKEDGTYDEVLGSCSPCPNESYFRDVTLEKLRDLWIRSKPHSPTGIRAERERGGWIVEIGEDQYDLIESAHSGEKCTRIPQVNPPNPDLPPGDAVAFVHTHPLPVGGPYDCGERSPTGGRYEYRIKGTGPSPPDRDTALRYRNELNHPELKFYVIAIDFGVYEYYWNAQGAYIESPFPGCIEQ